MAREQALRLEHGYVGPEHLALGLLAASGTPATVLERLGVDPRELGERIAGAVRPGSARVAPTTLPYTSLAKKVLEYSMDEARRLSDGSIGTVHLLLALIREGRGVPARVLAELGVGLDDARRAAAELGEGAEGTVQDTGRARPAFRVRIDDEASVSIYEQIVARIREGVATGSLRPGQRLWPVRTLADDLDIAPGTVGRAYRELERLGVVETDGARGTRVADPGRASAPPDGRKDTLVGLLRPVAVAAFHMGASAGELREALEPAIDGILDDDSAASGA